MFELRQTEQFAKWFRGLKDERAKTKIAQRLVRVQSGNTGDVKFFENIGELRIHHGPGYRLYFVQRGKVFILLLCGGDKSTQQTDIERATRIAKETSDDT